MLTVYVFFQSWFVARGHSDEGQATAEYALVLLGAAAVALLLVAWATHTNRIGKLLDSVVEKLLAEVK